MAIKATFLTGKNETQTDSLYQWDYGQVLEIESAVLSSNTVEVHFACSNMSEAIVRLCTFSDDGVVTVAIPDDCLEQTSLITAWIYEIAGTQGRTSKVIRIPIIARTRPSVGRDIPTDISNQYTELITEVNEVIDDLKSGKIEVQSAITAKTANSATTAGNASSANYAVSAGSANTATKALKDADGIDLKNVLHCPAAGYAWYDNGIESEETSIKGGLVAFKITRDNESDIRLITEVGGTQATNYSATFYDEVTGGKNPGIYPLRLVFTHKSMGNFNIKVQALVGGAWYDKSYAEYPVGIYYKHLIDYPMG